MRTFIFILFLVLLSSCVTMPLHVGGERIEQSGLSFIPPTRDAWSVMFYSTYQLTLAKKGKKENKESIVINSSLFELPKMDSAEQFLKHVKKGRTSGPKTGRFEILKDELILSSERPQTCVIYDAFFKDYGARNKGEFEYLMEQTYGMYCIHPNNRTVGVSIGISKRSASDHPDPAVKSQGEKLLRSVEFTRF